MKISTRAIIGSLIAAGAVLQDPTVANMSIALAVTHPHVAALVAVIVAIGGVLHDPKIERALGVDADEPEKESK